MEERSAPTYTMGDNPLAGDRLALLAEVFEETSGAFLAELAPAGPALAVDLGCGPGFTTRLLADTTGARRTVGLDASENFVERARRLHPDLEFEAHDVTLVPLPAAPADVIFVRYLLTHLPDAAQAITTWATQLAEGGRLLVEDVEAIETDAAPFRDYLEISGSMMRQHGGSPYVGEAIARYWPAGDVELVASRTVTIAPTAATAARLFQMNLATWRHNPWVVANVEPSRLDRLDAGLAELGTSHRAGEIRWTHRQAVYERG